MNLYSAFIVVPHTQGAQVRVMQCYLQITPYLPLPRKRSPDGASPDPRLRLRISNCSLLLIYIPRKDERLSRPGWLTYSGQFTHISDHPSAAGRAQDRESSPVKERHSTNSATQPTVTVYRALHRTLYVLSIEYEKCLVQSSVKLTATAASRSSGARHPSLGDPSSLPSDPVIICFGVDEYNGAQLW